MSNYKKVEAPIWLLELKCAISPPDLMKVFAANVVLQLPYVLRPPGSKAWQSFPGYPVYSSPADIRFVSSEGHVYYVLSLRERTGSAGELKQQELINVLSLVWMNWFLRSADNKFPFIG